MGLHPSSRSSLFIILLYFHSSTHQLHISIQSIFQYQTHKSQSWSRSEIPSQLSSSPRATQAKRSTLLPRLVRVLVSSSVFQQLSVQHALTLTFLVISFTQSSSPPERSSLYPSTMLSCKIPPTPQLRPHILRG